MITAEYWIEALGLEEHVEGGYFRRTFQADHRPRISTPAGDRYTLTSIHYLLTRGSPVGHWHLNRSDILHFHHHGEAITYHLLYPDGRHRSAVLGQDLTGASSSRSLSPVESGRRPTSLRATTA
nr:cupin domain-containing protein [Streptomyces griseus]